MDIRIYIYTSDAQRWSSDNWICSLFSLSNFFPPLILSTLLSVRFNVIWTIALLQPSAAVYVPGDGGRLDLCVW